MKIVPLLQKSAIIPNKLLLTRNIINNIIINHYPQDLLKNKKT